MKTSLLALLSIIGITLMAQNLQSGLVAHYPLDTNGVDLSLNRNNLIIDSTCFFTQVNGNDGALSFNGTNRAFQSTRFNNDSFGSISVALWFKANTLNNRQQDQTLIQGAFSGFSVSLLNNSGMLRAFFANSSFFSLTSNPSINYIDSNWHHVVAQNNGRVTSLYIDGVFNVSMGQTLSNGIGGNSQKLIYLAGTNLNARFFNGDINDVRIYNRVLTQAEITALATFPTTTSIPSQNIEEVEVKVYPNPNNGNFSISSIGTPANSNITIRNMLGQRISQGFLSEGKAEVTLEGEQGIYFIEINTPDNKKIVTKVIMN